MSMKNLLIIIPITLCLLFSSCKKDDAKPELPPATQTGERTFGAYVNGEVWVPKGRPSTFQPNLNVVYDPGYKGGTIEINAYRDLGSDPRENEEIFIYMTYLNSEGIYSLTNPETGTSFFYSPDCNFLREEDVYRQGTLEITHLDMEEGIVSGKFEFTLAKPGCDTIRVTEGRFDYKL
jgi:hypothetical protein